MKNAQDKYHHVINVPIADLVCQLIIDNYDYFRRFKRQFSSISLSRDAKPSFTIKIEQKDVNTYILTDKFPYKHGVFPFPRIRTSFKNHSFSLIAFIQYFIIPNKIILLHGSSFIKKNKAYIFCGPSGVGKSTLVKQIPRTNILSDDTVVLKMIRNQFYVYQSPFDNIKYPYVSGRKVPLAKIFFLKQAAFTRTKKLRIVESLDELFYNTSIIYHRHIISTQKKVKERERLLSSIISKEREQFKNVFINLYKLVFDLVLYTTPEQLFTTKQFTFLDSL